MPAGIFITRLKATLYLPSSVVHQDCYPSLIDPCFARPFAFFVDGFLKPHDMLATADTCLVVPPSQVKFVVVGVVAHTVAVLNASGRSLHHRQSSYLKRRAYPQPNRNPGIDRQAGNFFQRQQTSIYR